MRQKHQSIRLFESDFWESLTKVHPASPIVVFVPVMFYLAYRSLWIDGTHLLIFFNAAVGGLLVWSFFEYAVHRFLFHLKPLGSISARLIYLFHGIHHDDPHDPLRLVMPPTVSIPLAGLLYFLFRSLLPAVHINPAFFGFIFGYLFYDLGHYAIHHLHFQNRFFKFLRRYHYLHHFNDADHGYGVSSPLWDYVFRSDYPQKKS